MGRSVVRSMSSCALTVCCLLPGSANSGHFRQPNSECVSAVILKGSAEADVMAEFYARIGAYVSLRGELQENLPAPQVTDDVAKIGRPVRDLARRLRASQQRPKEGEIFTRTIAMEIRRRLCLVATVATYRTIMDDNPGRLSRPVSRDYPEGKPRATTPPTILAILPRLPPEIEYRFVGADLVLLDTRANIVVDRMAGPVACGYCGRGPGKNDSRGAQER
jgi:hypothetical protein